MSLYHRLINQLINNVRQMVARQIDCGLNLQFIFVEVFFSSPGSPAPGGGPP